MGATMLETICSAISETVEAQTAFVRACTIEYDDINAGLSSAYVVGWNKWRWAPLTAQAQAPLGAARIATDRLRRLITAGVQASEKGRQGKVDSALRFFDGVLDQSYGMWGAPGRSLDDIVDKLSKHGDDLLRLVRSLPTAHAVGERLIVPDANALVWRPDLSSWHVDIATTMVIVPQITRELDELKTRDKTLATKAQKVINQLNEFDRRGDPSVGVVVAGKLKLREVAMYPDFASAPEFLDASLADDRVLASALELAWANLNAEVLIVTRDRNMKNRARLAGLPYRDVDEFTSLPAVAV